MESEGECLALNTERMKEFLTNLDKTKYCFILLLYYIALL